MFVLGKLLIFVFIEIHLTQYIQCPPTCLSSEYQDYKCCSVHYYGTCNCCYVWQMTGICPYGCFDNILQQPDCYTVCDINAICTKPNEKFCCNTQMSGTCGPIGMDLVARVTGTEICKGGQECNSLTGECEIVPSRCSDGQSCGGTPPYCCVDQAADQWSIIACQLGLITTSEKCDHECSTTLETCVNKCDVGASCIYNLLTPQCCRDGVYNIYQTVCGTNYVIQTSELCAQDCDIALGECYVPECTVSGECLLPNEDDRDKGALMCCNGDSIYCNVEGIITEKSECESECVEENGKCDEIIDPCVELQPCPSGFTNLTYCCDFNRMVKCNEKNLIEGEPVECDNYCIKDQCVSVCQEGTYCAFEGEFCCGNALAKCVDNLIEPNPKNCANGCENSGCKASSYNGAAVGTALGVVFGLLFCCCCVIIVVVLIIVLVLYLRKKNVFENVLESVNDTEKRREKEMEKEMEENWIE